MRVLLIGAGAIAHHHAAAARLLPGAAILAADPSPEARAKFAEAFPEATLYDTPEAMLAAAPAGPEDIALVAVPPWLHEPMAVMAFAAGFHVLCEKPLARDLPELDRILAAGAAAGKLLGDCCIRFNAQPAMAAARDIVEGGELGPLNLVRMINRIPRMRPGVEYQPASRWFINREKAGGGVLMDWAVYDIAMLFDVLRPTAVTLRAAMTGGVEGRDDPPDHPVEVESHAAAFMELTLPGGQTVPLLYERANGVNGPQLHELSVEGRNGGLSWQWLPPYEDDTATLTRHVDAGGKVEQVVERIPMGDHPHFHHQPLLAFADRVRGLPSSALTEAEIRFRLGVIRAIYEVADGEAAVTLTLADPS
ncbi:MAG: Gfo/Idh/MocA family oxidoreductase [Rubellimicrobium sp.]|nr:Gfo/Idh/MocA family oxidoreductase [Rubellimicrobium sp.]